MDDKKVIIDVDHVTIRFNLASEKIDNLKEYFIKLVTRKLMFQEFLAVKDVSFQVRQGEAWGLLGANGSRKVNLLKNHKRLPKHYKGPIPRDGLLAPPT